VLKSCSSVLYFNDRGAHTDLDQLVYWCSLSMTWGDRDNNEISVMTHERTLTVRRIHTRTVFRLLAAGIFCSIVPFTVLMGVLAAFGMKTVSWNNEPVTGITGLLASPFIGLFIAAFFTAIAGVGIAFGLWLYSRFRPLTMHLIEEDPEA
jgi:hypothetical protein